METLVQKLLAGTGLLTIAEVSELVGFHPVTLRDWVRAGHDVAAAGADGFTGPVRSFGMQKAQMRGGGY